MLSCTFKVLPIIVIPLFQPPPPPYKTIKNSSSKKIEKAIALFCFGRFQQEPLPQGLINKSKKESAASLLNSIKAKKGDEKCIR